MRAQYHIKLSHCYIHCRLAAQDLHPVKKIIQRELFDNFKHFQFPIHKIIKKDLLRELHAAPLEIRMQHAIQTTMGRTTPST
ncbi:hypothetical protein O181_039958 [Austropuccinia psidii MF-1]|uniref:Uncharacterized protein n=1 Tax=Austropuccinia psidii MF-1 TaxID=1389203 RepID=A0A9Q3HCF0_9BASI|nr:hypothetical protein [Austropuccinia psidii MF-1]